MALSSAGRDERFRREVFELFEGARQLLGRWSIGQFLKEYRGQNTASVVCLDSSATAGDSLRLLAQAKVLSAPVVDTESLMVSERGRDKVQRAFIEVQKIFASCYLKSMSNFPGLITTMYQHTGFILHHHATSL